MLLRSLPDPLSLTDKARKPGITPSPSRRRCETVTGMTGPDRPTELPRPTMATAFPDVTARVVALLNHMGHSDLADSLAGQYFYGRCHCRPGCTFVLTAPPGSSGSLMVWLEIAGETVGEASLDPEGQTVTDLDISDPETLGIPPDWLDQGLDGRGFRVCRMVRTGGMQD